MRHAIPTLAISAALAATALPSPAASAPFGRVEAIACAPTDPQLAAAIVDGTLWITRDGGRAWRSVRRVAPLLAGDPEAAEATLEVTEATEATEATSAPPLVLAVGDRGEWAVANGSRWAYDLGAGPVTRDERTAAVAGLAIDSAARLWVAAGERLVSIAGGRTVAQIPIAGVGAPALGTGDAVLVPGALGIVEVAIDAGDAVRTRIVGRIAEAIAADPADGAILAIRRGVIARLGADGSEAVVARSPLGADRLVVADGAYWIRAGGAWQVSAGASPPRPRRVLAVAVDAAGRPWFGGEQGPVAPGASADATRFAAPGERAAFAVEIAPRPIPPCPRPAAALLPRATLSFGFGLREVATRTADGAIDTAGTRSWFAAGLALGWTLAPPLDAACAIRKERTAQREGERRARLADLHQSGRRAAAASAAAASIEEAIASSIAADATAALIAAFGGRTADGKEEDR